MRKMLYQEEKSDFLNLVNVVFLKTFEQSEQNFLRFQAFSVPIKSERIIVFNNREILSLLFFKLLANDSCLCFYNFKSV